MTGDSENEFEGAGETPATPPDDGAGERARPSRKHFRAWGSVEKEESALGKLGKRISGIFSKPKTPESVEQSSELELIMPEPIEAPDISADTTADIGADTPATITAEDTSVAEAAFDVIPDGEPIAAADVVPEVPAEPKKGGLFTRLFGRKPKAEPVVESFEVEKEDASELSAAAPEEEPLITPLERATYDGDIVAESAQELGVGSSELGVESLELGAQEDLPTPDLQLPTPDDEPYVEHATEPMPPPIEEPTTAPIPESVGLFGRLFSRKPKVSRPIPVEHSTDIEPTVEEVPAVSMPEPVAEEATEPVAMVDDEPLAAPVFEQAPTIEPIDDEMVRTDEHAMQQTFSSVEDALPAEPQPTTVDLLEAALAEPIPDEEKKPGFFSRLFGRKSRSAPRPSLEIELHEDRIEAAAHALDEVSGESFVGAPAETSDPYASVDDALPAELQSEAETAPAAVDDSTLETPAITAADLRFAPPLVQSPSDSRATLEIEPFDPFAETLDPNRQPAAEPATDSHSLPRAQAEPRSTEELELEAELGLTKKELDEIDEKTDEFAIPSVDTEATTGELLETETTQAAKLTWWMRLLGRKPKTLEAAPGLPTGTVVEGNPNFLFSKFKAFYNEIIRFKHQKTEFAAGFSTAILTDFNADLSPDAAAAAQSEQLKNMLDLQAAEAQWMGGEAKDRYPDAQYAMACMADELFTYMEWDGQSAWKNHLLEVKLFRSHAADVELFKRIDKLLKDSPNSHVARDLARVYLMVLAAGFQGKYRPFGLPRALAQYRQRLYEYIHQGDSLMLYAPERKIFPDAAARTLEGHAVGRFSSLQRWAAILIFMMLGYTVLAHYAWNRVSADLKDVTERIRAASSTSGAGTSPSSTNSTAANGGGGGR